MPQFSLQILQDCKIRIRQILLNSTLMKQDVAYQNCYTVIHKFKALMRYVLDVTLDVTV